MVYAAQVPVTPWATSYEWAGWVSIFQSNNEPEVGLV